MLTLRALAAARTRRAASAAAAALLPPPLPPPHLAPPHCAASTTARSATATSDSAPLPATAHAGLVLGIESSCDDTGVAVVTASGRVLGESLATQAEVHAAWGGVVPKLAQEAHEAAIDGCVEAALAAAGVAPGQLSAVAVTIGPGLSLCLRVGAGVGGGGRDESERRIHAGMLETLQQATASHVLAARRAARPSPSTSAGTSCDCLPGAASLPRRWEC